MAELDPTQALSNTTQASKAGQGQSNYDPQEEKQVFMEMLVAQMENQSPSDPMDPNKMTTQMAQLNAVEQQTKTNDFLQQLVNQRQGQKQVQAASLVGRNAWVDGGKLQMESAGEAQSYRFDLKESKDVSVQIVDQYGRAVHEERTGNLEAGSHELEWDGTLPGGGDAPAGEYQVRVTPAGEDTDPLATQVQRTIQEVRFDDAGTQVGLGNDEYIPFDKVSAVSA